MSQNTMSQKKPSQNSLLYSAGSEDSADSQGVPVWETKQRPWSFSLQWCVPMRRKVQRTKKSRRKEKLQKEAETELSKQQQPLRKEEPAAAASPCSTLESSDTCSEKSHLSNNSSDEEESEPILIKETVETAAQRMSSASSSGPTILSTPRPNSNNTGSGTRPPRSTSLVSADTPPRIPPSSISKRAQSLAVGRSSNSSSLLSPPNSCNSSFCSSGSSPRANRGRTSSLARSSTTQSLHRRSSVASQHSSFTFSVQDLQDIFGNEDKNHKSETRKQDTEQRPNLIGFAFQVDTGNDTDTDTSFLQGSVYYHRSKKQTDEDDDFWLSSSDDEDEDDDKEQLPLPDQPLTETSFAVPAVVTHTSTEDWMLAWTRSADTVESKDEEKKQDDHDTTDTTDKHTSETTTVSFDLEEPSFLPSRPRPASALQDDNLLSAWAHIAVSDTSGEENKRLMGLWYCQMQTVSGGDVSVVVSRLQHDDTQTIHLTLPCLAVDFVSAVAGHCLVLTDGSKKVSILPVWLDSSSQLLAPWDSVTVPETKTTTATKYAAPEQQDAVLHWRFCLDSMLRQCGSSRHW